MEKKKYKRVLKEGSLCGPVIAQVIGAGILGLSIYGMTACAVKFKQYNDAAQDYMKSEIYQAHLEAAYNDLERIENEFDEIQTEYINGTVSAKVYFAKQKEYENQKTYTAFVDSDNFAYSQLPEEITPTLGHLFGLIFTISGTITGAFVAGLGTYIGYKILTDPEETYLVEVEDKKKRSRDNLSPNKEDQILDDNKSIEEKRIRKNGKEYKVIDL